MDKEIKISSNRSFGIVFFIVFFIIGIYPLKDGEDLRYWIIFISLIFLFLGLINSKLLTPLNRIWFKFGVILGNIISPIILGLVFFFVVTPTAFMLKAFGKDVLKLKKNKNNSYWIEKSNIKSNMKNQF